MAKHQRKATKRKSKRLKAKSAARKVRKPCACTQKPAGVRKSSRINHHHAQELISREDNEKCEDGRPRRQQTLKLPTSLCCADISREALLRIKLNSCSNCDSYRLDRAFMAQGSHQGSVCKQRYQCKKSTKIGVAVKFSHHHVTVRRQNDTKIVTTMEDENKYPDQTKTMKRKVSQFERYARTEAQSQDLKKCKNKIADMSNQFIFYKCTIDSVVEKKADSRIKELVTAQDATVKKLKRRQYYLEQKNKELMKQMSGNNLTFFVNKILKGMHFKERAALVLDMVVSGKMFGDAGKDASKNFVQKEVRKVFTAWRLCRAKDTAHQGCLNLQGLEAVRRTQELEKGEQGFIASKSAIWREGDELLRKVGYPMFKPTHEENEIGEIFTLDFEMVIRFMLETNNLTQIAKDDSIEILFTLDFAALTQGTGHIFGACRNIDTRSRKNGQLIYVEEDGNGRTKLKSLQSNRNVYPMIMVYCRDGKEAYRNFFKDWFAFIYRIKKHGLPYRDERNPALKPFLVRIPQDVSSIQKSLNMGGACKACDLFCHMCACRSYGASSQLMSWREDHLRCRMFCLSAENPPKKCFHWEVDDEEQIVIKKQRIKVYLMHDEIRYFRLLPECFKNNIFSPKAIKVYYSVHEKFATYHIQEDQTVQLQSKMKTSVTDVNRHSDPSHIDFVCPLNTSLIRTAYSSLLDSELILRKMFRYCSYPVEIKQKYLRLCIRNGNEIIDMRRAVDRWCKLGENNKMIEVSDAVLCVLHLELRCSENKISNLLNEGFAHRKTPNLVKDYIDKVEKIVNQGKIGRSSHQNQWRFPANKSKDGIASDFSLKGEAGKNILSKSSEIINISLHFHRENIRSEWRAVLAKYQEVLAFLNRRHEFTDKDIRQFQQLADEYSEMWAHLTGLDGQTNYEHSIKSSHLSYYLSRYGNLYKYSQQGFEAMMSKIKCIYSRCTSRGGAGAEVRSHILQICHFLIRSMLWNSGHGDMYFKKKYCEDIVDDHDLFDIDKYI